MLETASLWFTRSDKFDDHMEGRFSPLGIQGTSLTDQAFAERYKIADEEYANMAAGQEVVRRWAFVNCWHINEKENPVMWASYTTDSDSVAVVSTPYDIHLSLPETVTMAGVSYINKGFPRTRLDHASLFFYKDSRFRYEAEFRLFTTPESGNTVLWDDKKDFGRSISINLDYIRRVISHPRISPVKHQAIEELVKGYCPRARVYKSCIT
jgi:hypothetical protein